MNRRTLLFFICVTISFYLVNFYFSYQMEQQLAQQMAQQPKKEEAAREVPVITTHPEAEHTNIATKEEFYVLENDTQQLVFSNKGAALVEINLALQDESHPNSAVRPIEIDTQMREQSQNNDYFPLRSYYTPGEQVKGPFIEHNKGAEGGYYPLLRRPLVDKDGKIDRLSPRFYALNIVSQYPELAETYYRVVSFEKDKIVFESSESYRRIQKTYTLKSSAEGAPYLFDLDIKIEGDSRGLWLTSGLPDVELISSQSVPEVKVMQEVKNKPLVESVSLPTETLSVSSFNPVWVCNSNGFFGIIIDPLSKIDAGYRIEYVDGTKVPTRLSEIDRSANRYPAASYPAYDVDMPLNSKGGNMSFRIYAGPLSASVLKEVDKYTLDQTGKDPYYTESRSFHGWFSIISQPIAAFLFIMMEGFYALTHSWGFSIILLTVALRVLLYPLNNWSMRSTRKMQQLAPLLKEIQHKYRNDKQKMQMETLNLYREHKANPLGGCLPMLIQLPFLFGMFDLLRSSFALRGASFIPGWIDNLASPDVLFQWQTPYLPLIGNQFHLLPIILGVVTYLQSYYMAPPPVDPNNLTDMERQQKMMTVIMPLVMVLLFYNFASGLNIYWISSTLLGIAQQLWINRSLDKESKKSSKKSLSGLNKKKV